MSQNYVAKAGILGWLTITIAAVVIGKLVDDKPGVWGALVGSLVAGVFFAITAGVAQFTKKMDVSVLGFAILGSWLLKIVVLLGALGWLKGQDFYNKGVLFGTLLVTTFGLLTLEAVIVTKSKVPYVEPERSAS